MKTFTQRTRRTQQRIRHKSHTILQRSVIALMACLLMLILSKPTWAEEFSSTNMQLLYGSNFHDPFFGYNTVNGAMTTVTLEHFGTWAYGDNFFFVDMLTGDFANFSGKSAGKTSRIYGEWHPRLSLSKISGHNLSFTIVKDVLLAGQINRDGEGFKADLLGLSVNLDIPGFQFVELDTYARKDNFNTLTYQVSLAWALPFGDYPISLTGYVDINGTDKHGTEINAQPQLLMDIGQAFNTALPLQIGVEWYYHHHRAINSSVPQAMMKWTF